LDEGDEKPRIREEETEDFLVKADKSAVSVATAATAALMTIFIIRRTLWTLGDIRNIIVSNITVSL